jgi:hypothetical protein
MLDTAGASKKQHIADFFHGGQQGFSISLAIE